MCLQRLGLVEKSRYRCDKSCYLCIVPLQLFMGFSRLGFVTVYLSDPLIAGFTTGAACHVFTSQIKHVFGVKTERYSGPFKLIYVSILEHI